ncbi:MAG TPA: sulfocyanin-like copper-binding protein [Casimicrobiaceae bacterium]|nr:sulfocyanin-like copper-binding protein [Casimicrobiaceae bacterium]
MRYLAAAVLSVVIVASTISPARAAARQVVQIALRDSSTNPAISGMQMTTEPTTVKAGRVTITAVNQSKDLVHEVVVIPAPRHGRELPYNTKTDTIAEKRAHAKGEISDLKPGAHGSVTLSLTPGTYLLVCNQPGHYKSGMFTRLVVEE